MEKVDLHQTLDDREKGDLNWSLLLVFLSVVSHCVFGRCVTKYPGQDNNSHIFHNQTVVLKKTTRMGVLLREEHMHMNEENVDGL